MDMVPESRRLDIRDTSSSTNTPTDLMLLPSISLIKAAFSGVRHFRLLEWNTNPAQSGAAMFAYMASTADTKPQIFTIML